MEKRSNHPESMKRAIINGFPDRARALCDKKHLHNIEDVFVMNGHPREFMRRFMEQTDRQKRAGRTGKSWSRDLTIFERVFCSSGELLTATLFELLSSLEGRLKRLNARVKSCLVKGRNVLCIRFLVPARILCR